jgi:hypothetical protein
MAGGEAIESVLGAAASGTLSAALGRLKYLQRSILLIANHVLALRLGRRRACSGRFEIATDSAIPVTSAYVRGDMRLCFIPSPTAGTPRLSLTRV